MTLPPNTASPAAMMVTVAFGEILVIAHSGRGSWSCSWYRLRVSVMQRPVGIISDAGTAGLFPGGESKRDTLVAGHDGWDWRGSQLVLLDKEVGHAPQHLLEQDAEFEADDVGGHAAVAA